MEHDFNDEVNAINSRIEALLNRELSREELRRAGEMLQEHLNRLMWGVTELTKQGWRS